ncbi:hypothetical protein TraAM80_05467 [Trypanosoma rangeli]|uniref:Uncharacterized protein n=1 Tax=Trypanosoma rangeli TaxID=5698 RepID=A0A3R7MDV3_TRYRA|nr:uncharacterized protein TraAM80_05467 [Trypanosoma rangeli]RNF04017.1 hypothetical protein TraAM80_05467 [Trypanosoma rangeli]|eukprot:RNF04017.1 hypothetical protein TraAM80_05467 [Trypanosoma rangeli]
MRRVLLDARRASIPLWCGYRRSSNKSEGGASCDDRHPSVPEAAKPSEAGAKEEYTIPTADILRAVRQRDFNAFQSHAVGVVQQKWKEEHNIPAACVIFFFLTWYWMSSSRRRVVRSCRATEAKVREEADQTLEVVNTLVRKWRKDVQKADQQLQLILDKNSELTKDIDRMTAALRQCYVKVPVNKAGLAKAGASE